MPVSAMAMLTQPPVARARMVMRPPSGVNFTALDSRFSTICLSRRWSATQADAVADVGR